jgi:hypothetical protein
VVQHLAALLGRLQHDLDMVLQLLLPDIFGQPPGPQRLLYLFFVLFGFC